MWWRTGVARSLVCVPSPLAPPPRELPRRCCSRWHARGSVRAPGTKRGLRTRARQGAPPQPPICTDGLAAARAPTRPSRVRPHRDGAPAPRRQRLPRRPMPRRGLPGARARRDDALDSRSPSGAGSRATATGLGRAPATSPLAVAMSASRRPSSTIRRVGRILRTQPVLTRAADS